MSAEGTSEVTGAVSADPGDGEGAEAVLRTAQGRSLLATSTTPAIGTALSRVTGLVRVGALTTALGLTSVADVYNLANTAPNILYELVLGGVLSSTLVPLFISAGEESDDESASVMTTVAFVAITGLTVLALLVSPLLNQLFAVSLDGAEKERQLDHGADFLLLLLPQIFFYGMTTLATALLHARRRFAAPAFAPVLTNVVISAAALCVYWFLGDAGDPNRTVYVLGLGTTAGVAAMAVALLPALRNAGVQLRWNFQPKHRAVRQVLKLSGWTVGFTIANSVSTLVVLTLARGADVGAVSAYQYAFIFFQLPYGLIAVSIMTAVLPELASAAAEGDEEGFAARFREGLSLLLTLMIPAAAAYLVLGRPLISLLLERGEFDAQAAERTADMLAGFSVGLPAFAVFLYCVRAFHARKNTRTPFYLNLGENALNVALVLPFIALFDAHGLSIAYSVAYLVAAAAAVVVLNRQVPGLLRRRDARLFLPGLLVAAAVSVWVAVANDYLPDGTGDVVRIVVSLLVAAVVFLGAVAAARPHGFEAITRRLQRLRR
jgi:putative peptidoglycan lipid II flippase